MRIYARHVHRFSHSAQEPKLLQITAHPHPYISHSNDAVRSYLLSRLTPLGDQYSHVHISNDLVSNASWSSSSTGIYFEGTNILVKIDGTSSTAGGVLTLVLITLRLSSHSTWEHRRWYGCSDATATR